MIIFIQGDSDMGTHYEQVPSLASSQTQNPQHHEEQEFQDFQMEADTVNFRF